MKRFLYPLFFLSVYLFLVSCFSISQASSSNEFQIRQTSFYKLDNRGGAKVTANISLVNNFANIYPQEFMLSLPDSAINISAYDQGGNIIEEKKHTLKKLTLRLKFNHAGVGKGEETAFTLIYYWPHFAQRHGQVWYLVLPSPQNIQDFKNYKTVILVPSNFHNLARSSITPAENILLDQERKIVFTKKEFQKGVIALSFADFQAFNFVFRYKLGNISGHQEEQRIPLPPVTNYQNVFFTSISPLPFKITMDENDNLLAHYIVNPGENKDIIAQGQVLLFASPERKAFYNHIPNNTLFLRATKFWPADNTLVVQKAQQLKTPRAIYNFVVKHLSYNLSSYNVGQRRGGVDALLHPDHAVCTEFTDLFITLARAAGIPAREVEGYAYTNNPKIRPGGQQILHAWPEYWDKTRKLWVDVDPTWGNTTGGIDYFSHFDLNHFALVIHGSNDQSPAPPGSYASGKSWDIHFAKNINIQEQQPAFSLQIKKISLSHNLMLNLVFSLQNKSLINIHPSPYRLLLDTKLLKKGELTYLPLLSTTDIPIHISPLLLPFRHDFVFKITINGQPLIAKAPLNRGFYLSALSKFRFCIIGILSSFICLAIVFYQVKRLQ